MKEYMSVKKIVALIFTSLTVSNTAQAHVTIEPKTATANQYVKLSFSIPHGCEGSPTNKITVQLPKGIISAKPQVNYGWQISIKKNKLSKPIKSHGKEIAEEVSEISWFGGRLEDEYFTEFGLIIKVPDTDLKRLNFPVIQSCEKGQIEWKEVTDDPKKEDQLKAPAPYLKIEAGSAHSHH